VDTVSWWWGIADWWEVFRTAEREWTDAVNPPPPPKDDATG
jgi:hypothetical protein